MAQASSRELGEGDYIDGHKGPGESGHGGGRRSGVPRCSVCAPATSMLRGSLRQLVPESKEGLEQGAVAALFKPSGGGFASLWPEFVDKQLLEEGVGTQDLAGGCRRASGGVLDKTR